MFTIDGIILCYIQYVKCFSIVCCILSNEVNLII